ncbi:hypothetical protein E4U43_001947 [Claviceps pusilla]|uniref:DUF676 domain-containing protein n=1 Tax=Claviceps pusilla TaxID=123648 RepID=A0A9P7N916_9HYPO|nr:hypothetical protein E4U43_001947 [Claviceps pusilla]
MLLLHQTGSVKIGEVIRYTVTYTPSQDRILPSPEKLYVRIRNTSTIALRAAFVHGPYTLSVSAYPSHFNPNEKFNNPRRYGTPQFEPMLKAGGSWECQLLVPDNIRQDAGTGRSHQAFGKDPEHDGGSATWVIEIASQVIFSTSAAVGFEVVVARDQKSLNLTQSLSLVGGNASQAPQPGKLTDHQQSIGSKDGHHPAQPKGVFSKAVHLKVEDSGALWNTPRLPSWDDDLGHKRARQHSGADQPVESMAKTGDSEAEEPKRLQKSSCDKKQKVHLVILTHGLHSNLGADMLYMKESIDAAARQARIDAKARRAKERAAKKSKADKKPRGDSSKEGQDDMINGRSSSGGGGGDHGDSGQADDNNGGDDDDDDDDEEVIVRGYPGNATKTEKGIKYLGKRLSRYILSMTYPDQPFLPSGKGGVGGTGEGHDEAVRCDCRHHHHNQHHAHQDQQGQKDQNGTHEIKQAHKHSHIQADTGKAIHDRLCRRYQITSISFVGHSLGGLIQTYAIAYIQKHSPKFFDMIRPINFIALATPFLGLSNENPLYVKFALDFGLVGRTGQDLGLTWRAPTIARSGWGALVSNLGESAHKKVYGESQPESKPLLRILPTGPAHTALKKFRNRTVYSNVVNDGIVPLRTSCLLFLDWQGLGRVEKARRDAGLVETVVGFGWAELTGTNMASSRSRQQQLTLAEEQQDDESSTTTFKGSPKGSMRQVPQPSSEAMHEDDRASISSVPRPLSGEVEPAFDDGSSSNSNSKNNDDDNSNGSGIHSPLASFFGLFRSRDQPKPQVTTAKQKKILRRGQTIPVGSSDTTTSSSSDVSDKKQQQQQQQQRPQQPQTSKVTSGHEVDGYADGMLAPPKTTFFESAGDVLNPSIPSAEYLIDPSKRPRTIFHDRVYHPSDIPPPPLRKRQSTFGRRSKISGKSSISSLVSVSDRASSSPYASVNPQEDSTADPASKDYGNENRNTVDAASDTGDASSMRVEEKIARGYHRDLSWRKVLVKLEPDAHNNMIVRRMFANAHGWPVIKHLVDAHFSDSETARLRDEEEPNTERAFEAHQGPAADGREVRRLHQPQRDDGDTNEAREEAMDELPELPGMSTNQKIDGDCLANGRPRLDARDRADSMTWSDRDWADTDNDSEVEAHCHGQQAGHHQQQQSSKGSAGEASPPLTSPVLSPSSWKWAEKMIVGKGSASRLGKNPQS